MGVLLASAVSSVSHGAAPSASSVLGVRLAPCLFPFPPCLLRFHGCHDFTGHAWLVASSDRVSIPYRLAPRPIRQDRRGDDCGGDSTTCLPINARSGWGRPAGAACSIQSIGWRRSLWAWLVVCFVIIARSSLRPVARSPLPFISLALPPRCVLSCGLLAFHVPPPAGSGDARVAVSV